MAGDPVPQALLITGIVVAFSATALAVAVLLRLFDRDRLDDAVAGQRAPSGEPDPDAGRE
jgi:multicomponent Na+:H+ antiporter subunit C